MMQSYQKGLWAEQRAAFFLIRKGLRLIKRRFRGPRGEIDLIFTEGETLVFVEVRCRAGRSHFGDGVDSIHPEKRRRLIHTARVFLHRHPYYAGWVCRFDVCTLKAPFSPQIDWLIDAFRLGDGDAW